MSQTRIDEFPAQGVISSGVVGAGCVDPLRCATLGAMAITIRVPGPLREYCSGVSELLLAAATVRAALEQLEVRYPSLYRNVCDETGAVRRHIGLFVNIAHMRDRDGLDTALVPGDVLTILPAVSGG